MQYHHFKKVETFLEAVDDDFFFSMPLNEILDFVPFFISNPMAEVLPPGTNQ